MPFTTAIYVEYFDKNCSKIMLNEILLNQFFTFCPINQLKWSCGFQSTQILIGIKNPVKRFRELKTNLPLIRQVYTWLCAFILKLLLSIWQKDLYKFPKNTT